VDQVKDQPGGDGVDDVSYDLVGHGPLEDARGRVDLVPR
jgi:hypothetical protein